VIIVELLVVVQAVAGSSPVAHPSKIAAKRQFGCQGQGLSPASSYQ
jgi:hypothetical protein